MKIKKITNITTAALFAVLLCLGCLMTIFLPKQALSESERRELATLPEFSWEAVLDGSYFAGLSDYVTDHFALRESFRTLNTVLRVEVLQQPDSGGVFEENGYLFEPDWPLDEQAITQNAKKLQQIADQYFAETPVYFSVIPDKADFAETDCPKLDTARVAELVRENFDGEYIDITGTLELSDYYRTDTHWRQEALEDTANALVTGMGGTLPAADFTWNTLDEPFYGVLWGRYAMPVSGDTLLYGTNEFTENAVVMNSSHPEVGTVYEPETDSLDLYDVFLSGASAVIEIESPIAETDRHLVLFRDSFGSSIAPWLLTRYEKITIIDIRYVSSSILAEQTELAAADEVLFLYSTAILNTGGILK